jgi:hypothetical protein
MSKCCITAARAGLDESAARGHRGARRQPLDGTVAVRDHPVHSRWLPSGVLTTLLIIGFPLVAGAAVSKHAALNSRRGAGGQAARWRQIGRAAS